MNNNNHPLQYVLDIVAVDHEEDHLPAGAALQRVHLLAALIVRHVALTGVKRLACLYWVKNHLVADDNLKGSRKAGVTVDGKTVSHPHHTANPR